MEISFDLFRYFVDTRPESQELMKQANEILFENIGNPELAIFILNSIQTQEVQNDATLIQAMTFVFYRIVNHIWSNLYPDQLDQYNVEVFSHIRDQIVLIYFNTPINYQNFIIDAIRDVITKEGENSEDLLTSVCESINPQVLEMYSSIVSNDKSEFFCDTFIQFWSNIANKIHECFSTQPNNDAFSIIKSASDIMNHLLNSATDSLLKPETTNLVQFFISVLVIPNAECQCIQMKRSILSFFNKVLKYVRNEQRQKYIEWIRQNFLEDLSQSFPQMFSTILESEYIGALAALKSGFFRQILFMRF